MFEFAKPIDWKYERNENALVLSFLWMMGHFVLLFFQSIVQQLNIHFPMFHPYFTIPFQNTQHTTIDSTPTVLHIHHLDWDEECLRR